MYPEWIDLTVRKPTKEDADSMECVVYWHVYDGVTVTGYHQYERNRFLTHWMPPPPPPANRDELRRRVEEPFIHYMREE